MIFGRIALALFSIYWFPLQGVCQGGQNSQIQLQLADKRGFLDPIFVGKVRHEKLEIKKFGRKLLQTRLLLAKIE